MLDIEWLLIVVWFLCLIIGLSQKHGFFVGMAGIISLFLGFIVMTDVTITFTGLPVALGLTFIGASLYIFYYTLFKMIEKGK